VGQGMVARKGAAATMFSALAKANVNIKAIAQVGGGAVWGGEGRRGQVVQQDKGGCGWEWWKRQAVGKGCLRVGRAHSCTCAQMHTRTHTQTYT
jgi:hypothetical protein